MRKMSEYQSLLLCNGLHSSSWLFSIFIAKTSFIGTCVCVFCCVCMCVHVSLCIRDLKLANIFLSKSGIVKVGDFGISRSIQSGCYAQTACGTPENMSPELCLSRPYGKPNDIWAMGCVLYELLSLRVSVALLCVIFNCVFEIEIG